MSRAAFFTLLSTDPILSGIFSAFYGSNSADDPPDQFVVIHWEDMPSGALSRERSFGPQIVTVWFHDHDRTYELVNAGIIRTKAILDAAVHVPGVDGWTITQCDWQGDSGDLWDDGYQTVTRNTSYRVVARPS